MSLALRIDLDPIEATPYFYIRDNNTGNVLYVGTDQKKVRQHTYETVLCDEYINTKQLIHWLTPTAVRS